MVWSTFIAHGFDHFLVYQQTRKRSVSKSMEARREAPLQVRVVAFKPALNSPTLADAKGPPKASRGVTASGMSGGPSQETDRHRDREPKSSAAITNGRRRIHAARLAYSGRFAKKVNLTHVGDTAHTPSPNELLVVLGHRGGVCSHGSRLGCSPRPHHTGAFWQRFGHFAGNDENNWQSSKHLDHTVSCCWQSGPVRPCEV